jgi:hypothetical protein
MLLNILGLPCFNTGGKNEIEVWKNPCIRGEPVHINVSVALDGAKGVERAAMRMNENFPP